MTVKMHKTINLTTCTSTVMHKWSWVRIAHSPTLEHLISLDRKSPQQPLYHVETTLSSTSLTSGRPVCVRYLVLLYVCVVCVRPIYSSALIVFLVVVERQLKRKQDMASARSNECIDTNNNSKREAFPLRSHPAEPKPSRRL